MAQQCILEYCNFGKGYLKIIYPTRTGDETQEVVLDLEGFEVVDGVITDIDALVARMKEVTQDAGIMTSIVLYLRCAQNYKISSYIPVKNIRQAKSLYIKDTKDREPEHACYSLIKSYKYDSGHVFSTYFMQNDVVESFLKLAKTLGTNLAKAQPLAFNLANTLKYSGTYAYFYIRQKACTMLLVSDGNLITSFEFSFESPEEIYKYYLLIIAKYEFEMLNKEITHYGIDSDEDIDLPIDLIKLGDDEQQQADY